MNFWVKPAAAVARKQNFFSCVVYAFETPPSPNLKILNIEKLICVNVF